MSNLDGSLDSLLLLLSNALEENVPHRGPTLRHLSTNLSKTIRSITTRHCTVWDLLYEDFAVVLNRIANWALFKDDIKTDTVDQIRYLLPLVDSCLTALDTFDPDEYTELLDGLEDIVERVNDGRFDPIPGSILSFDSGVFANRFDIGFDFPRELPEGIHHNIKFKNDGVELQRFYLEVIHRFKQNVADWIGGNDPLSPSQKVFLLLGADGEEVEQMSDSELRNRYRLEPSLRHIIALFHVMMRNALDDKYVRNAAIKAGMIVRSQSFPEPILPMLKSVTQNMKSEQGKKKLKTSVENFLVSAARTQEKKPARPGKDRAVEALMEAFATSLEKPLLTENGELPDRIVDGLMSALADCNTLPELIESVSESAMAELERSFTKEGRKDPHDVWRVIGYEIAHKSLPGEIKFLIRRLLGKQAPLKEPQEPLVPERRKRKSRNKKSRDGWYSMN